jgi:uncharacterized protein (TIGR03067 family)
MRRVIPLFVIGSLGFAPAPVYRARPDQTTDLERMQGGWVRVSLMIDGKRREEAVGSIVPTIKGDTLSFAAPSDRWRLTLDATKTPKRIESRQIGAANAAGFMGIYKLEGDRFIVCWRSGKTEADRSASFDPAQAGVWLCVYERKKP